MSPTIRSASFARSFVARLALAFAATLTFAASVEPAFAQQRSGGETGLLTGTASPLQAGFEALSRSDYKIARENLEKVTREKATRAADSQKAWLGLGQLSLLEGKLDEAISAAKQAERGGGKDRLEAATIIAQALARQGKMQEAIAAVRKVEGDPDARFARVVLGELLLLTGDSAGARAPLMSLVVDYNNDTITDRDGESLALVGRAAHLLRSANDANDAYNKAEKAGAKSAHVLLWRAELFLDKQDTGHAEEVLRELLKRAPNHPDALVAMARAKLEQAYDFTSVERLIDKAVTVNPTHTGAFFHRAGLALREFDLARADSAVNQGLRTNPNDLDLLSMRAATRFMADDAAGFAKARQEVLQRNPQYSQMYQIIGEYAEWEHRYSEIVAMMQEAVQVNPRDGMAWSVLGLNLIRMGEDVAGVDALRKSWKLDRFNVRVYNTLNLYEKDIPNLYETVDLGNFRFRFDKSEREVLERYVPTLMEEAFSSMVRRYGFTPKLPVGVELYSNPQHFAVRTSGLPAIGIQGVCFGRTLASQSPKAAPFNWANVLWHELGHVFAIQLSTSHVPRWFTEGLSEYETFLRNPQWQREEDMSLYVALKAGRIPKIESFNRAFTHAESPADIPMAYYAASQIVVYIGEQFGMGKIAEMLRLWGQAVRDPDVVKRALGIGMSELDTRFRQWLTPRLARYEKQFVPDLRAPSLEDAEKAANKAPNDVRAQVEWVLALLSESHGKDAKEKIDALKKSHPKDPTVGYIDARLLIGSEKLDAGRKALEQLITNGHDGYAVRIQLAEIAQAKKDQAKERAHLEAARRFDPTQVEALKGLYDLASKEKRKGDMIAALRELSVLDQHEPRVVVRLLDMLVEAEQWQEARKIGQQAIQVDLHNAGVHRRYAQALAQGKQHESALFELESAVLCGPKDEEAVKVYWEAAKVYQTMGRTLDAKKAAQKVLELNPNHAEARELVK